MIGIKGIAKKPIIDATADASDVMTGKVFYNNSGKIVGTLSPILSSQASYQLSIPKGATKTDMVYGDTPTISGNIHYAIPVESDYNNTTFFVSEPFYKRPSSSSNCATWGYLIRSININSTDIKYNGIILDMVTGVIKIRIYVSESLSHNDENIFIRFDKGIYDETDIDSDAYCSGIYLEFKSSILVRIGYVSATKSSDSNYSFKIYLV